VKKYLKKSREHLNLPTALKKIFWVNLAGSGADSTSLLAPPPDHEVFAAHAPILLKLYLFLLCSEYFCQEFSKFFSWGRMEHYLSNYVDF